MERIMKVHSVSPDGTARVCRELKGECENNCSDCSGCGERGRDRTRIAQNPIGAKVGDRVYVAMRKISAVKTAFFLYVMPVVLFLIGYIVGEKLWKQGPMTGMGGLFLALVLATVYDRFVRKQKKTFTITGFAPKD